MDSRLRKVVRQRARQRCEYCRLPDQPTHIPFHVEHIVAVVHQPNHQETNLAWACPHCNWHKGPNLTTLDLQTGDKVDLFNPRTDAWEEHFVMEAYLINGMTPKGRGTVQLLQMNLPTRIEVRQQVM